MFLREKKNKVGYVLQLVEGYRDITGNVKQSIILSLGGMRIPSRFRSEVNHFLKLRLTGERSLFPPSKPEISEYVAEIIRRLERSGRKPGAVRYEVEDVPEGVIANGVVLDGVDTADSTHLGPLLPLEKAWNSLGLSDFMKDQGISSHRIAAAKVSVFNRLVDPVSEHGIPAWQATMSTREVFKAAPHMFSKDVFYRASDDLLDCRDAMEKHLAKRETDIFNLANTMIFYDLTNTYFEGGAEENPMAKRGHSKEKRSDCPLLTLGLVLNEAGFPRAHKVFAGNMSDAKSLGEAIQVLQDRCGLARQGLGGKNGVVVLDGGIATKDNLKLLRDRNFDYIVNDKRTTRGQFSEEFRKTELFTEVPGRNGRPPVFVRRIVEGDEAILLCRSDARKAKEDAMVSSVERKFLDELEKLKKRIEKRDRKLKIGTDEAEECVNQAIGSKKSHFSRASQFYSVAYNAVDNSLTWIRNDEKYQEKGDLHGCYKLRTSRMDISDEVFWKSYINLTKCESAFRALKADLGLHPIYHRLCGRCEAHFWITVLAYHLLRWVERTLESNNIHMTWRSVRRLLETHMYNMVTLPCANGRTYKIHKPGLPDEKQKTIYRALGIELHDLPVTKRILTPVKK